MLDRQTTEQALISAARQQGFTLDGRDLLELRTSVAASLAAKERHRERMSALTYQCKPCWLSR